MKLELKHLAPYLLHGLKIKDGFTSKVHEIKTGRDLDDFFRSYNENLKIPIHKLLLYPLSMLTQEIEHNGGKVVLTELFEIGDDGGYNLEFDHGNTKLIEHLGVIAEYNIWHDVKFLPYAVVQELLKHHFDIFNLIPAGLAIDKTTI